MKADLCKGQFPFNFTLDQLSVHWKKDVSFEEE